MALRPYIPRTIKHYLRLTQSFYFLNALKRKAKISPRNRSGEIYFNGLKVTYPDMLSFYMEYKDIFLNRIYHFEAKTDTPYIIDGGGYIGMAILYFKTVYPKAQIVSFEPDENIFKILQNNMLVNGLNNVELIQAGLAGKAGTVSFLPDDADGGKITSGKDGKFTIKTVCLSEYLTRTIDFLKLNIEGQELPVLVEAENSGKLHNIKELVIEYHGWAGERQQLGTILELLDRNGFHYLVHDFDAETCNASKPPFHWTPQTTWFCLIYGQKQNMS
jgi:FkbM family methyltransferase